MTKLLNCLTFLSREETAAAEGQRGARQILLADEVTSLFRGAEARESAKRMTSLLHVAFAACEGRGGLQEALDSQDGIRTELHLMASLSEGKDKGEAKVLRLNKSDVLGQSLVDVLVLAGLVESKGEFRMGVAGSSQSVHDLTGLPHHLLFQSCSPSTETSARRSLPEQCTADRRIGHCGRLEQGGCGDVSGSARGRHRPFAQGQEDCKGPAARLRIAGR